MSNGLPNTTEKILRFLRLIFSETKATRILRVDYERQLAAAFGSNHQTLSNYKTQMRTIGAIVLDEITPTYFIVDAKKTYEYVMFLKKFFFNYPHWDDFDPFILKLEEAIKKEGERDAARKN